MSFPSEIQVTELRRGGVRFKLPRRQLGALSRLTVDPMIAGIVMTVLGATWTIGVACMLFPVKGNEWFIALGTVLSLLGLVTAGAGLAYLASGLFKRFGRTIIQVSAGRLWVIDRLVGPIQNLRGRRLDCIRRLRIVMTASPSASGQSCLLVAECDEREPFGVAIGYPDELIVPLAAELSRRCRPIEQAIIDPQSIEVVSSVASSPPRPDRWDQPRGSRAILNVHSNGVTITIPPQGIWRAGKWWVLAGALWIALLEAYAGLALNTNELGWGGRIAVYAFRFAFWSVGVLFLFMARQFGHRRAVFATLDDRLLIFQSDVIGSQRHEWSTDRIISIVSASTDLSFEEPNPSVELQVYLRSGDIVRLFSDHEANELDWIASHLRKALNLPAITNGS